MSKASDDRIRRWVPAIESIRADLGLTAQSYPNWLVLALIQIESNGDPDAHRTNSQFYGLLQIGVDAAKDVGRTNVEHGGDGELAIDSFLRYSERYARGPTRHNYEPEKISILWKSGPGTVKRYNAIQKAEGQLAAEQFLAGLWGGSALAYLNKFRRNAKKWSDGKAKVSAVRSVLPGSSKRPGGAIDGSELAHCNNLQATEFRANPNELLAFRTKSSVESATRSLLKSGKTWFRTDPVDPSNTDMVQTRNVRLLRNNRLETVVASFPHSSEAIDYVTPLVALAAKARFGSIIGKTDRLLNGIEYDTVSDPRQFVHAIAAGRVSSVSTTLERGNLVTINHDGFFLSEYGHLSEVLVKVGDSVQISDIIARAGQTLGKNTAPSDPAFLATQAGATAGARKLQMKRVPAIRTGTGGVNSDGYDSFKVREDIEQAYMNVYNTVKSLGGFLPSSGGARSLNAEVSANRSATSMHYTGLAIDLYVQSASKDLANDKLFIVSGDDGDPRRWHVYSRATGGTLMTIQAWNHNTQQSEPITAKLISLTDILAANGYTGIRRRKSYKKSNYGAAEWWHFDFKGTFVNGVTSFGEVLLTRYTHKKLQGTPPWRFRDAIWSDARGDFVGGKANREIARRKGRRLPAVPEASPVVVAVPRARPDPVLFFALLGRANLFDEGQTGGDEIVAVDPNAILRSAPPPGTLRAEQRAEDVELAKGRDGMAELAMLSASQTAHVAAESAYDTVTAVQRACALADAPRATFFSQEDNQRQTRTAYAETAVAINPADY